MFEREYFLKSMQIYASTEPAVVCTVLGSCVSVCVFDKTKRIGGMNHFLLPRGDMNDPSPLGKFGNLAVPELVRRLVDLGAEQNDLVAKIAGGASILSISTHNHIPDENVRAARKALAELSIPIVGQDVGGKKGRKVVFHTGTGFLTINGTHRI